MTGPFSEIGQNRAQLNEISGADKAASLFATHTIVEEVRYVTVEGSHDCAKYVFQGNHSILNGCEGGSVIFENAIIGGYREKGNAICTLGIILAYNVIGISVRGRVRICARRERISGWVWLFGSGRSELDTLRMDC